MHAKFHQRFTELVSYVLSLQQIKQLHALFITTNLIINPYLAAKLLRSYAAGDDLYFARLLFDTIPNRTTLLWNSIIRAHARCRDFYGAFSLFNQMNKCYVKQDSYTFACVLRACTDNSHVFGVKMTHGYLVLLGFSSDIIASTAVISSYVKLGLLNDAANVFDRIPCTDLVSCNALMIGYGHHGFWEKGLDLFHKLRGSGGIPDAYTLVGLISCFRGTSSVGFGSGVHGFIMKAGHDSSDHVMSSLVSMYSRCMCLESAYRVFTGLFSHDLVTWTSLITGFSVAGRSCETLKLFTSMNSLGKKSDPVIVSVILSACAQSADIVRCKEMHSNAIRQGFISDARVSCALIDAYAKCGFPHMGFGVFEMIHEKNLVAYNTVISCMGSHGLGDKAIEVFEALIVKGLKPDKATFSALLCACCHCGLEKSGVNIFKRMRNEFGVEPELEHYVYVVKLLGMVGRLEEAYDLIHKIPLPVDSGIWGSFLWGCSIHGRVDLGEFALKKLLEREPQKAAYRIMLSNMYSSVDKWGLAQNLRDEISKGGLHKVPGFSWVG